MSALEIIGYLSGAVSVWFYIKQRIWAWPVGLVNSAAWLIMFWQSRLFLDASLQIMYLVAGVLGWYWWVRGQRPDSELRVARTGRVHALLLVGLGMLGALGLWRLMVLVQDSMPFLDSLTTVISLIAQYLLTRKRIATWACWITVDVAYIGMYIVKGFYLTASLQPVFIALCVLAWRAWRVELTGRTAAPEPAEQVAA
jgi:nicotinamide mononucleotide transporter